MNQHQVKTQLLGKIEALETGALTVLGFLVGANGGRLGAEDLIDRWVTADGSEDRYRSDYRGASLVMDLPALVAGGFVHQEGASLTITEAGRHLHALFEAQAG